MFNCVAGTFLSVCLCMIVTALTGCASNVGFRNSAPIGNVIVATVKSDQAGFTYPIYIYLPASYANEAATYPVIYVTDGDTPFPPDGRLTNFEKILLRHRIDAILVGIGGTQRRAKDYNLPGAIAYHEFITQQLIPFVESNFRADPKRRILSGISYGGSFVVTALFLEALDTPVFSYYISAEGSFFLPSFVTLEHNFTRTIGAKNIPATLILARGAVSTTSQQQFLPSLTNKNLPAIANSARNLNEGTNGAEVDAFYRRMVSRHYADLILIETSFPTDHIGTDNPSFDDAMSRIFRQED